MEPGALRRRLDDIYLHRRELGAASAPATRTCVAADVAETQPMSEEIRFRLDIWPLQQMGVLADFSFLWTIAARDSHVELIYQEHLLEWMHVGNLLDDLACCLGAPRGDHRFEDAVCIAAKGQRRCAADGELSSPCELRRFHNGEKLTLLRKLADHTSAVSLVACPSKAGKRMLAEFWMPRLEPRLTAPVVTRLDFHCFQRILTWVSLCEWYQVCRAHGQWSRWLRRNPAFQSVVSDARWARDPELIAIQQEEMSRNG